MTNPAEKIRQVVEDAYAALKRRSDDTGLGAIWLPDAKQIQKAALTAQLDVISEVLKKDAENLTSQFVPISLRDKKAAAISAMLSYNEQVQEFLKEARTSITNTHAE